MKREMNWEPKYGMDHPTWDKPEIFWYKTAEEAREAIVRIYGKDSGHVVVEMRIVSEDQ